MKVLERHKHAKEKARMNVPYRKQFPSQSKKEKYRKGFKKVREKRSFSNARYVEALLVGDSTMVDFHEDGDVETYMLTIMNMVSFAKTPELIQLKPFVTLMR